MLSHLDIECPICGSDITISIEWEEEHGEFGTLLSTYPVMNRNPDSIDHHGTCFCDFSKPLVDAFADYLEDGRLDELVYIAETKPTEDPLADEPPDLDAAERALLEMIAAAGPAGLRLGELIVISREAASEPKKDEPEPTPTTS